MKYSFYDAAEKEFFAAIEYYEECQLNEYVCTPMHGQRLI